MKKLNKKTINKLNQLMLKSYAVSFEDMTDENWALGIIKLSNKGLIFSKDFNIIPFKNKLTTIIDSKVYCKKNWISWI